jgi:hypothetical protein
MLTLQVEWCVLLWWCLGLFIHPAEKRLKPTLSSCPRSYMHAQEMFEPLRLDLVP